MGKYYITFGTRGQLFSKGWIVVNANSVSAAEDKFVSVYGSDAYTEHGYLSFASMYSEAEMIESGMLEHGNYGVFCHEEI